jgi:ABC-type uncharacterized transport system ATPase component
VFKETRHDVLSTQEEGAKQRIHGAPSQNTCKHRTIEENVKIRELVGDQNGLPSKIPGQRLVGFRDVT